MVSVGASRSATPRPAGEETGHDVGVADRVRRRQHRRISDGGRRRQFGLHADASSRSLRPASRRASRRLRRGKPVVSRVLLPPCGGDDSCIWDRRYRRPRATYPGVQRGGPPRPPLFGLAPGGVCPATSVTGSAVSSYLTVSPLPRRSRGGLFSVALSVGSLPLGVTQHPALRSSDFPRTSRITGFGRHAIVSPASHAVMIARQSALSRRIGDPVHERLGGQPGSRLHDLPVHQGDRGEAPTEGERVDLQHDQAESGQERIGRRQHADQDGRARQDQRGGGQPTAAAAWAPPGPRFASGAPPPPGSAAAGARRHRRRPRSRWGSGRRDTWQRWRRGSGNPEGGGCWRGRRSRPRRRPGPPPARANRPAPPSPGATGPPASGFRRRLEPGRARRPAPGWPGRRRGRCSPADVRDLELLELAAEEDDLLVQGAQVGALDPVDARAAAGRSARCP